MIRCFWNEHGRASRRRFSILVSAHICSRIRRPMVLQAMVVGKFFQQNLGSASRQKRSSWYTLESHQKIHVPPHRLARLSPFRHTRTASDRLYFHPQSAKLYSRRFTFFSLYPTLERGPIVSGSCHSSLPMS